MSNAEPTDPIERVKAADGDLVLDFNSRIGARPYARYVDGAWELMSLTYVPTPDYGQDRPDGGVNTEVHTVDLEPDADDWTEPELREIAKQPRPGDDPDGWPGVDVIAYEESPFARREEIPAKDEIVTTVECPHCGEYVRQYLPDPLEECSICDRSIEDAPEVDRE
jgi:hypothetical protein